MSTPQLPTLTNFLAFLEPRLFLLAGLALSSPSFSKNLKVRRKYPFYVLLHPLFRMVSRFCAFISLAGGERGTEKGGVYHAEGESIVKRRKNPRGQSSRLPMFSLHL